MKKLVLLTLMSSVLVLNVSCDSDELVAGAVGVGVGVAIGNHYDRHHRRHRHFTETDQIQQRSSTEEFARVHRVPLAAAQKIETAFNNLDSQGLQSFALIGLQQQDVRTIASERMPSSQSIQNVGNQLGIGDQNARRLLVEMKQTFAASARDSNSDYWQACMESGAWRTPQNQFCKKTFWNGCSPETGATACY